MIPPLIILLAVPGLAGQGPFQEDVIATSAGDLHITFVGHGTLMLRIGDTVIHVDPVGREADYDTMPDADVALVTHEHGDHLDEAAIAAIRTDDTRIIVSRSCGGRVDGATTLQNGQGTMLDDVLVEAVPAYNIVHMRSNGQPYHPKGNGNGYILTFGDTRVYIAGDTENTPEMKALQDIDAAFLPMNLPYTMTPDMVADAARAFRPGILYPYHFGETDTAQIVRLLEGSGIEVRIREMQ